MVSYDTEVEPELNDEATYADGKVEVGEVRRVLACGECGTELKDTTLTFGEIEVKDEAGAAPSEKCADGDDHDMEIEVETSADMRMVDKDRHGKPITNPRYMKTEYGVTVDVTVTCTKCKQVWKGSDNEFCAASAMDELV